jgi:large subunit ribosomal protein L32
MAVPKRRHSKARVRSRRSQWRKIRQVTLVECPQCHELKVPHRVCAKCGYYNKKQIVG